MCVADGYKMDHVRLLSMITLIGSLLVVRAGRHINNNSVLLRLIAQSMKLWTFVPVDCFVLILSVNLELCGKVITRKRYQKL